MLPPPRCPSQRIRIARRTEPILPLASPIYHKIYSM